MNKYKILKILILLFLILLAFSAPVLAQEDTSSPEETPVEEQVLTEEAATPDKEIKYKAKILELDRESCPSSFGGGECLFFELEIISGEKKGEHVSSTTIITDDPRLESLNYKKGQEVYIVETNIAGESAYYVKEPIRKSSLILLVVLFIVAVIAIGGIQGISSLFGLLASFLILRFVVLSMLLSGSSPLTASIFGGSLILTVSVYLSHGFNKKTSIALVGTLIALVLTGILSLIFTQTTQLTGYATEESTFLIQLLDSPINMRGVLLASLILGGIGVLDDVTVSQVSTALEIFKANPTLTSRQLFKRSMVVGRDHIASMVNTLVLAYTSSSLPFIMLFIASGASLEEIINYEQISEEIVRTLIGSIGLVLAVPITTILAVMIITQNKNTQTPLKRRY